MVMTMTNDLPCVTLGSLINAASLSVSSVNSLRTHFAHRQCVSTPEQTSDEIKRVIWLILVQERLLLAQGLRLGYISAFISRPQTTFEVLQVAFNPI